MLVGVPVGVGVLVGIGVLLGVGEMEGGGGGLRVGVNVGHMVGDGVAVGFGPRVGLKLGAADCVGSVWSELSSPLVLSEFRTSPARVDALSAVLLGVSEHAATVAKVKPKRAFRSI